MPAAPSATRRLCGHSQCRRARGCRQRERMKSEDERRAGASVALDYAFLFEAFDLGRVEPEVMGEDFAVVFAEQRRPPDFDR